MTATPGIDNDFEVEPLAPPRLPAAAEDETSDLVPLPVAEVDWHLIILIPSGPPDDRMVESLADAAGVSPYDARLSLASTTPKVFRRMEGGRFARGLSVQLKASRIPHYVVSEQSLLTLLVSRAQRGVLKERALEVSLDGTALSIPYEDILLCVRGEITRENHNERKLATAKGANRSLSPDLLLHLYSKEASAAVEVDPESFTWPSFGHEPTRSALLNLEHFLDALEDKSPGVLVDRGFDRELPVLSRAGDGSDLAQILSGSGSPGGVLFDNEDQFRFYARWRYRLERHLTRASR